MPRTRSSMLYPLASQIHQYLNQHKPCAPGESPAPYTFAMRETLWETLSSDPVWKQAFDNSMTSRNKSFSVPWHSKYPVRERLPPPSPINPEQPLKPFTIVDIGGSQGVDLQRFATAFPDVPCELILQNLRETVNGILPGLDPRIRPMVCDFFTPQLVKGADIYYLKSILHDWNNEAARKILSNTAQVMGSHSRLLINEMVLAETGETLARVDMDMLMWLLCDGMERTRRQWEELLGRVEPPLQIVAVWPGEGADPQCVIETCLVGSEAHK